MSALPEATSDFRRRLLDGLDGANPGTIGLIDQDHGYAACPVCQGPLTIRFHGAAARANVNCIDNECGEDEIVRALARALSEAEA